MNTVDAARMWVFGDRCLLRRLALSDSGRYRASSAFRLRARRDSSGEQATKILATSLFAYASLSKSIKDVVVLTTKLRIARTCVAYLTEPLDREIRQDCIQFGRHLRDHFKLACGSIG